MMRHVVSRLDAAIGVAMAVFFVCQLAGWDVASTVAGAVFLALVFAFVARVIYRRMHGASWTDALGRTPPRGK
jgi:hypothetical protein